LIILLKQNSIKYINEAVTELDNPPKLIEPIKDYQSGSKIDEKMLVAYMRKIDDKKLDV
jgi:hypothetical protein